MSDWLKKMERLVDVNVVEEVGGKREGARDCLMVSLIVASLSEKNVTKFKPNSH